MTALPLSIPSTRRRVLATAGATVATAVVGANRSAETMSATPETPVPLFAMDDQEGPTLSAPALVAALAKTLAGDSDEQWRHLLNEAARLSETHTMADLEEALDASYRRPGSPRTEG